MGFPLKVVVMMAKAPGGWQKRQNDRDHTPHLPHVPPKPGRGDMDSPSALQLSGQVGSPLGSPHTPGTPAALVPTDTTISPDSAGTTGHDGTSNSPGTHPQPLRNRRYPAPHLWSWWSLRMRQLVNWTMGASETDLLDGIAGQREPAGTANPRWPAQEAGTGRGEARPGRGSDTSGCRGTGQQVRGGGSGAPPRRQAEGELRLFPGALT